MDEIRQRKLEEQIREELSSLILSGEVKDPRVGPFTSLTRVEAARDLSYARVFVSSFAAATGAAAGSDAAVTGESVAGEGKAGSDPEGEALAAAVAGLNHAAGFMQARLARRIHTRLTPKLQFIADRGIKEGLAMNERIKGLFT
ncbi:MAG: ribosome-binding factor A [Spirochaetota bacterium]